MSAAYLITWLMVFLRAIGVLLQLPLLAGRPIPVMVRMGVCACLATLLAGIVPTAEVPLNLYALALAAAGEVLLGLALGFVSRISFAAVEIAGRIISSEIGLTATPGIGVPDPAHEPLAALFSSFAVIFFFMSGGHQMLLNAFARSFYLAAAGRSMIDGSAAEALIRATSHVIELGLRIAAPFIALNFLINLAFSVLGRAVPKMSVFVLSMSLRSMAGLALLSASGSLIARYLFIEFADMPIRMLQILPTR